MAGGGSGVSLWLLVLCRLTVGSYEPIYGSSWQLFYNETPGLYRRFPNTTQIPEADYQFFISELNFEAIGGKIVAGAADKLYLLGTDLEMESVYMWETDPSSLSSCSDSNQNFTCRNHIRVYKKMPINQDLLFVCGTQAAQDPQCRTVDITGSVFGSDSAPVSASEGVVSYYPEFPGFGEFRADNNTDTFYFTAGFFFGSNGIGRHYSISYQSVDFSTPSNPNTLQTVEQFRTINDQWLNFPVTFVDFYRADYAIFPPATATEHSEFYFVFLRENSLAAGDDTSYSRVVRICRNDLGSTATAGGTRYFTSFLKARIFCEREVPPGRQFIGAIEYRFNVLRSMVFNEGGRYYQDGLWVKTMYGAFSGPVIGPTGSAICAYRADDSAPAGDGFNRGIFDIFREDLLDSTTGVTVSNSLTRCDNTRTDMDAEDEFESSRDIDQMEDDPILLLEGFYVTQMVVDRVCVVRDDDPSTCVNQDVLFLGTDSGEVLKVAFGVDSSTGVQDVFPAVAEEIYLDDNNTINEMLIEEVSGTKFLYVSTWSKIYRLPLERCSRHNGNCSNCIGSRDPYCVWNTNTRMCEASSLAATGDATGSVPSNIVQNIHTGEVASVCDYPEVGFQSLLYQVNENGNTVEVTVSAVNNGAIAADVTVEIYTEDGSALSSSDYSNTVSTVTLPNVGAGGTATAMVDIQITDDSVYEGDEYFLVRLRDPGTTGVTITEDMATINIVDDDFVTLEFSSSELVVVESNCYFNVTVQKLGSAVHTVRVIFTTEDGNATAGDDYVANEVELTFSPDDLEQSVLVALVNNDIHELTETFSVRLTIPSNQSGVQLGQSETTIIIQDDDTVTVGFTSVAYSALEADGSVDVILFKDGSTMLDVVVILSTRDQSALTPSDYTGISGRQITFAPEETRKTVTVNLIDNSVVEEEEAFTVELSVAGNQMGVELGQNETTVSITDDDSVVVGFTSPMYTVSEGNASVTVIIMKSGANDIPVNVLLTTTDGSATAPDDYSAYEMEVSFNPSSSNAQYVAAVPINNDNVLEASESFFASLSVPSGELGVEIGLNTTTVTVVDDDAITVEFAVNGYTVSEGDGCVEIPLVKIGESTVTISVVVFTGDRTAEAPADYTAISGMESINFAPDACLQTVSLCIEDDGALEVNEDLFLRLSVPIGESGVQVSQEELNITIIDDDAVVVELSQAEYIVSENETSISVTVVKNGAASVPVSVRFSTLDGTAEAPSDYDETIVELIFRPSDATQAFTIPVVNDNVHEVEETFTGRLTLVGDQRGVSLGRDLADFTINDDDSVILGFESAQYSIMESMGYVNITISKTGSSATTVTVVFATSDDTASASDYSSVVDEVFFAPNVNQQSVVIPILNDNVHEPLESFTAELTISTSQRGVEIAQDIVNITIIDDDVVTVEFQQAEYTVTENGNAVNIVIVKRGSTTSSISVQYSTTDVNAQAGTDYASTVMQLTLSPGDSQQSVSIPIMNDEVLEDQESFSVTLSLLGSPTGVQLAQSTVSVVIMDDDNVTLEFGVADYSAAESDGVLTAMIVKVGSSDIPVSALFSTLDGTAEAPSDFTETMMEVTLEPSSSTLMVTIPVVNDNVHEVEETFTGRLTLVGDQRRVSLGRDLADFIINDDDSVEIGFESAEYSFVEDRGYANLTITKTGLSDTTVTVMFATAVGITTASESLDYSEVEIELCFASNVNQQSVVIPILNDEVQEPLESFTAELTLPSNQRGVELAQDNVNITIIDDEVVTVEFQQAEYTVTEGGNLNIVIVKRGSTTSSISVQYSTTDVNAQAGTDYASTVMQLTLSPGDSQQSVSIPIMNDEVLEDQESFSVTLSLLGSPTGVQLAQSTVSVVIMDDDNVTLEFGVADYSAAESDGVLTATIVKVGSSDIPVSALFSTLDGTAEAPSDFTETMMEVTLEPSSSTLMVTIPVVNDNVHEVEETFTGRLTLVGDQRGVSLGRDLADFIISDDDSVEIGFESAEYSFVEDRGYANLTITKTGLSDTTVTVMFATAVGVTTASESLDYSEVEIELCFTSNVNQQSVVIPILNDEVQEPLESFTAELTLPSNQRGVELAQDNVNITIIDDDGVTIRFQQADYTVSESGNSIDIVVVKLGSTSSDIQLQFSTVNDSAQAGIDYNSTDRQFAISPEETQMIITVPIVDDETHEVQELFSGTLSLLGSQSGVQVVQDSVSVAIVDDDNITVGFGEPEYITSENNSALTAAIVKTGSSDTPISILFSTLSGSAEASSDYNEATIELILEPSDSARIISIPLVNDEILEPVESFLGRIALESTQRGVFLGRDLASFVINDDDCLCTFSTSSTIPFTAVRVGFESAEYSVEESRGFANLTITRSGSSATVLTVVLATSDGSATASDYSSVEIELCFTSNVNQQSVVIPILNDNVHEPLESFTAELTISTSQRGVELAQDIVDITIIDDDVVTVEFEPTEYTVSESDGSVGIRIVKRGQADVPVSVTFTTENGTATDAEDYQETQVEVLFPADATETTVVVTLVTDTDDNESEESFFGMLTLPSGQMGVQLGQTRAVITIGNEAGAASGIGASGVGGNDTNTSPGTTTALFQLALRGVGSCGDWTVCQAETKAESVVAAVVEGVQPLCQCGLSSSQITNSGFLCNNDQDNYTTFRGELNVTGEPNAIEIRNYIEQWAANEPVILVEGVFLTIDAQCPVNIQEEPCIVDGGTGSVDGGSGDSSTGATMSTPSVIPLSSDSECTFSNTESAATVLALLIAVIIVLLIIIIILVCALYRLRKKGAMKMSLELDSPGPAGMTLNKTFFADDDPGKLKKVEKEPEDSADRSVKDGAENEKRSLELDSPGPAGMTLGAVNKTFFADDDPGKLKKEDKEPEDSANRSVKDGAKDVEDETEATYL